MLIMIDPGHGGSDPGCVAEEFVEATLVYEVASEIRRLGGASYALSRVRSEDPTLTRRAYAAKCLRADAAILLHFNACSDPRAYKSELYSFQPQKFWGTTAPDGWPLGTVHHFDLNTRAKDFPRVANCMRPYQRWNIPAVLFEMAYLADPNTLAYLRRPSNEVGNSLTYLAQCIHRWVEHLRHTPVKVSV